MANQPDHVVRLLRALQPTFEHMKQENIRVIVEDHGKEAVVIVSGEEQVRKLMRAKTVKDWAKHVASD